MMKVILFLFAILAVSMANNFRIEDKPEPQADAAPDTDFFQDNFADDALSTVDQSKTILSDAALLLATAGAQDNEFDFWVEVQGLVDYMGDWAI